MKLLTTARATNEYDDAPEMPYPTHARIIPDAPQHHLALGMTDYSQSYYLDGKVVYDGSLLALKTVFGWLEGLFTWSGETYDLPKLVFPGRCAEPLQITKSWEVRWVQGSQAIQ